MKDLVMLVLFVAAFVIGGALILMFGLLPEEHADEFRSLSDSNMTFQSDIITIKEPTVGDDTHIYAVNEVAASAVAIAQNDTEVKRILQRERDSSVTIAGVQPTVLVSSSGELIHGSVGQVVITANRAIVDGVNLEQPVDFESVSENHIEATQQIWTVIVDLDTSTVSSITKDAQRRLQLDAKPNLVVAEMNLFLPHAVKVEPGSTVRWLNDSSVPHNVVGSYTINSMSEKTKIDSGFFGEGRTFQYTFDDEGTFEYRCTIHSEEGMKGTLLVQN